MALSIIIDESLQKTQFVNRTNYPISDIVPITRQVRISEVLPFRVRFTTIGLPGSNANVPGIGLQIIEVNNYIL
jgi:hypothetical protein